MKKISMMLLIVVIAITLTNCSDSTSPEVKLLQPTELTISQVTISGFQLNWEDNSSRENGYKIERKFDDGNWEEIAQLSENSDEYLDDISVARQTWNTVYYKVYSYEGTDVSEAAFVDTDIIFPAPTDLTATYSNDVFLAWTDNSDGEDGFNIERKKNDENYEIIYVAAQNDTTYVDDDVETDNIYYYRVNAFVGIFNSSYTNEVQISTQSDPLIAEFYADTVSGYAPLYVNFTDNSTGDVISWNWDFGNGETSTLQNPSVEYLEAGLYTVSLTISDSISQSTEIKDDYITVEESTSIFQDGFETYDDFVLEFDPWTLVDVDGSTTYSIGYHTFQNQGYTGSYIIFNPSQVNPPLTDADPHSGDKIAACFADTDMLNNDWMITPQISLDGNNTVSFWAKSYTDLYGLERFNVGVSTTGTEPADFTIISPGPYIVAPLSWTQYSFDLSAYAGQNVYIAIQCVSADAFFLMVDDFLVGPTSAEVTGNQIPGSPVNGNVQKATK